MYGGVHVMIHSYPDDKMKTRLKNLWESLMSTGFECEGYATDMPKVSLEDQFDLAYQLHKLAGILQVLSGYTVELTLSPEQFHVFRKVTKGVKVCEVTRNNYMPPYSSYRYDTLRMTDMEAFLGIVDGMQTSAIKRVVQCQRIRKQAE